MKTAGHRPQGLKASVTRHAISVPPEIKPPAGRRRRGAALPLSRTPIPATIDARVIARETLSTMRKDVTAKCYGGDATRKKKLLEKQKAGKNRIRQFGKAEIPQEAFISALKMDS